MKTKILSDFQICISVPLRRMGRRENYNFVTKLHILRILFQIKQTPIQGIFPFLYKIVEKVDSPHSLPEIHPENEVEKIKVID